MPTQADYIKGVVDVFGPTLEFSGWIGYLEGSPAENGYAVLMFSFTCPYRNVGKGMVGGGGFRFRTAFQNSGAYLAQYPGAGAPPVSYPVPAALIKITNHRSKAAVSGKLYRSLSPNSPPNTFATWDFRPRTNIRNDTLTAFTKVALIP
jgi:hypothetical protein